MVNNASGMAAALHNEPVLSSSGFAKIALLARTFRMLKTIALIFALCGGAPVLAQTQHARIPECPPSAHAAEQSRRWQFVFGEDPAHESTDYLSQIDKLFGVPAATRNWDTIMAIARFLKRKA